MGRRNHFGIDSRTDLLRADDDRIGPLGDLSTWSIEAAQTALGAYAATLLSLLDDPDAGVRCNAAYALTVASVDAERVTGGLHARLQVETEPAARASLILGIAEVAGRHGTDPAVVGWAEMLWSDPVWAPSFLRDVRFIRGDAERCTWPVRVSGASLPRSAVGSRCSGAPTM
jgi:hypothetical protein